MYLKEAEKLVDTQGEKKLPKLEALTLELWVWSRIECVVHLKLETTTIKFCYFDVCRVVG